MREMLATFEAASSQKINLAKSSLLFSAKTSISQKTQYGNMLGMETVERMDNYLGLPLYVGKNKTNAFRFLVDRLANKIKGGSKRLLSRGGKEVFSKAVLQSLTYPFSVFMLPRGIIDSLEDKAYRLWWESKKQGRGWAMFGWDTECMPKGMRGLGFKDMRLFNIPLLGRHLRRLVNNKNTLYYHVLSSKYFPNGDSFCPKNVNKPSYVWSSMCMVASALRNGFGRQVPIGEAFAFAIKGGVLKGWMVVPCFILPTIIMSRLCEIFGYRKSANGIGLELGSFMVTR